MCFNWLSGPSWETCWAKCCNSKDAELKLDLQSEHPKELVTSASKQCFTVRNNETVKDVDKMAGNAQTKKKSPLLWNKISQNFF
jgi:hypothetical protein